MKEPSPGTYQSVSLVLVHQERLLEPLRGVLVVGIVLEVTDTKVVEWKGIRLVVKLILFLFFFWSSWLSVWGRIFLLWDLFRLRRAPLKKNLDDISLKKDSGMLTEHAPGLTSDSEDFSSEDEGSSLELLTSDSDSSDSDSDFSAACCAATSSNRCWSCNPIKSSSSVSSGKLWACNKFYRAKKCKVRMEKLTS